MSLIENGFGGINLLKTVKDIEKRLQAIEEQLLHNQPVEGDPGAPTDPPPSN